MRYIFSILFFSIIFQFSLFSQQPEGNDFNSKGPKKEKVAFKSMQEFQTYQAAVERGEVKPLDKAELEKWYNQFVEDIDQQFHSASKPKIEQTNPENPALSTAISQGEQIDLK